MEELMSKLTELFKTETFECFLKHANIKMQFTIEKFFIKHERYTEDNLLYIKPSYESGSLKDRKLMEHVVFKKVQNMDVEQVIIPYYNFWEVESKIAEGYENEISDYNAELLSFILKKIKNKVFNIKNIGHKILFKVHPYKVENGVLTIDIRHFTIADKPDVSYETFIKEIEEDVLNYVSHLGIEKVQIVGHKPSKVISESDKIEFVKEKKYSNYLTSAGLLSFTITHPENEHNIVNYSVKNYHCLKDDLETFKLTDDTQAQIERIVNDDVKRYGFKGAKFQGQTNIAID